MCDKDKNNIEEIKATIASMLNSDPRYHYIRAEFCLNALNEVSNELEGLKETVSSFRQRRMMDNQIIHNMIAGDQAAYIDWEQGNFKRAMQRIIDRLEGPGHLPLEPEKQDADEFYEQNKIEYDF